MYDSWLDEHIDYYDPDKPDDGPVECECCLEPFPESALDINGYCAGCSDCFDAARGGCDD